MPLLDAHFAKYDYLLGARPCVGDFGLMGPLYAHLYRDPAPGKLMKKIAPNVAKWVERMNQENPVAGHYLDNDEVPDTLIAILTRQFEEFWPTQIDTLARSQQWIQSNPNTKKLPRMLGEHTFTLGDITEKRVVRTFSQWKLQRVLDVYQGFDETEKALVDPLLHQLDAYEYMQTSISHRVYRENNILVAAHR